MKYLLWIFYALLLSFAANSYLLLYDNIQWLYLAIPAFLWINAFAGFGSLKSANKRLQVCNHGAALLLIFQISVLISVICHALLVLYQIPDDGWDLLWSAVLCVCVEAVVFWNGILCVYLTSVQLGIKHRVIGALCGMIPVVNLVVLNSILRIVFAEVRFEAEKEQVNIARKDRQICATRYPILLVHGVFFRDSNFFNYWGRIPKELIANGAKVYYGNQPSAASVADCAEILSERVQRIVRETGCEKVNIIAHSKGGLDCRYAIAKLDMAPYVASLTTINTPHRGCQFADYLLSKAPEKLKEKVATMYNTALQELGDLNADFLAAVSDLTASACIERDLEMELPEGIYCQSIASRLNRARGGKFPMNFSYHLVKYFDGPNDGLVSEQSSVWGERHTLLTPKKKRGISHSDMIDLNRQNIPGFDVREFYVELVQDLKERDL